MGSLRQKGRKAGPGTGRLDQADGSLKPARKAQSSPQNASLDIVVPPKDASLDVVPPPKDASLDVVASQQDAGLDIVVPSEDTSLDVLVPSEDTSQDIVAPSRDTSLDVMAPQQDPNLDVVAKPLKVCIVGSGNWGSVISKIIGGNVSNNKRFASMVKIWVFEEIVDGRKLTDIINSDHENVKYLPGHRLPDNVVATPSLTQAVQDADLLVFASPQKFIRTICDEISDVVPKKALGLSLIKGIDEGPQGLKLISDIIRETVNIDVSVLMGANIANDVVTEKFCETTIGSKVLRNGLLFKELLQTPNFQVTVVRDSETVELCGALKNIVAMGAGFCDSFCYGASTKAAVIRLGLMEMISFARAFCKDQVSVATFLESCGVADLISSCYGGRNHKVAEALAKTGKTIEELEEEMLNGQKLEGPHTSAQVYRILKQKGLLDQFPLFTVVYQICYEGRPVAELVPCLQNHPDHR